MKLAEQRALELSHQKESLLREFEDWRQRSEARGPLEKHHTQVRRISARLAGLLEGIQIQTPTSGSFHANETAFRHMLGAQRIWDFFRSKLVLREASWLRDDLMVADEFAWECYQPPRDRAVQAGTIPLEAVKEPPLVFFNSDASPFAQARETAFAPQGIQERDIQDFGNAIFSLPIPIIGVPWSQLRHLPSAVTIAHEVGHAVEHDLLLEATVESLIQGLPLPDKRKSAWLAWRHEVFADVYGVLCCGPASVAALMAYLVTDVKAVQEETLFESNWGTYPSRFLRMNLNFELLRQLDLLEPAGEALTALGAAGGRLDQDWSGVYQFHQMSHFDKDVPAVVKALLEGPYPALGGVGLRNVIAFSQTDLKTAGDMARKYIFSKQVVAEGEKMRRLLAAAALAYAANPQGYAGQEHTRELGARFRKAISAGVRSGAGSRSNQEIQVLETADRQAGASLLDFFTA